MYCQFPIILGLQKLLPTNIDSIKCTLLAVDFSCITIQIYNQAQYSVQSKYGNLYFRFVWVVGSAVKVW